MTYLSTPRFLLSTSSSPILSGRSYLEVGSRLPSERHRSGQFRLDSNQTAALDRCSSRPKRIAFARSGCRPTRRFLRADHIDSLGPVRIFGGSFPTVVIDRPGTPFPRRSAESSCHGNSDATTFLANIAELPSRCGHIISNGVRAHLNQIAGLRMQASEWDVDIALDLEPRRRLAVGGRSVDLPDDFRRCNFLRIGITAGTLDGRFRASLTDRALSSCAELGFDGMISLVTPVPGGIGGMSGPSKRSAAMQRGRMMRKFSRMSSSGEYTTELSAPVEFE